jgi:hypothetical protein
MTNTQSRPPGESLNVFTLMAARALVSILFHCIIRLLTRILQLFHPDLHPRIDLNKPSLWLPHQLYDIVIPLAESATPPVFESIGREHNISGEELEAYLKVCIVFTVSFLFFCGLNDRHRSSRRFWN